MFIVNDNKHPFIKHEAQTTVPEPSMLTTVDNPYNPFTNFEEWQEYDEAQGYYTCEYLARIVRTSDDLSETDEAMAIDMAINEIIRHNVLGIYKKVTTTEGHV